MNIQILSVFFMWCTIINFGLLILMSLILVCAGEWIYRIHSKWFPMSRETFNVVIYSFLGLYKTIFIVFCLVPYIVLLIMK